MADEEKLKNQLDAAEEVFVSTDLFALAETVSKVDTKQDDEKDTLFAKQALEAAAIPQSTVVDSKFKRLLALYSDDEAGLRGQFNLIRAAHENNNNHGGAFTVEKYGEPSVTIESNELAGLSRKLESHFGIVNTVKRSVESAAQNAWGAVNVAAQFAQKQAENYIQAYADLLNPMADVGKTIVQSVAAEVKTGWDKVFSAATQLKDSAVAAGKILKGATEGVSSVVRSAFSRFKSEVNQGRESQSNAEQSNDADSTPRPGGRE